MAGADRTKPTNLLLLLSPTEHELLKILPSYPNITYRISSLCESNGADVIARTPTGLIGYQRKTLPDLKSSLIDGRLYKELAQLTSSPLIKHSFLIIEHDPRQTTTTGEFLDVDLPVSTFQSLIVKSHTLGVGYLPSTHHRGTIEAIANCAIYLSTSHSKTIRRTGSPKDVWGRTGNRQYLSYMLQSFPGVGPKIADAIVNHFDGRLPMMWTCDIDDLMEVPGIGKSTASRLWGFFNMNMEIN